MTVEEQQLILEIQKQWQLVPKETISLEDMRENLAEKINLLIQKDFPQLISALYRIDVSETRLRKVLMEHPQSEGGKIIADLIIERQLQKIKTRHLFSERGFDDTSGEEKW